MATCRQIQGVLINIFWSFGIWPRKSRLALSHHVTLDGCLPYHRKNYRTIVASAASNTVSIDMLRESAASDGRPSYSLLRSQVPVKMVLKEPTLYLDVLFIKRGSTATSRCFASSRSLKLRHSKRHTLQTGYVLAG